MATAAATTTTEETRGGGASGEGHTGAPPTCRCAYGAPQDTNPARAPSSRPEAHLEEIRAMHEDGAKQRAAPGGAQVSL